MMKVLKPYEKASQQFRDMVEAGMDSPCDLRVPKEPPAWLDKQLFFKGQKYFWDNALAVLITCFRNLITGLFIQNLCDPLVLTRRSETRIKASHRYLDTLHHLCQFYELVPWEDSSSLKTVSNYHMAAATQLQKTTRQERHELAQQLIAKLPPDENFTQLNNSDRILFENFKEFEDSLNSEAFKRYENCDLIFSQFNMSMVHVAFFESVVVNPTMFGASHTNLEAFVHFWRVIGYYLGIPDKLNFARSTLVETQTLLEELTQFVVMPSIVRATDVSLHMAKCVTEGNNASLYMVLYSHALAHGIQLKKLWDHFTLKQAFFYYYRKFIVTWLYKMPVIRQLMNWLIFYYIRKTNKKNK